MNRTAFSLRAIQRHRMRRTRPLRRPTLCDWEIEWIDQALESVHASLKGRGMVRMYLRGTNTPDIARRFGCSRAYVAFAVKRLLRRLEQDEDRL